mgnify:CR=1 FL=1
MSPIAHSDRGDDLRTVDEPALGVAGGVDDVCMGLEDAVGEPVRAEVLPDLHDHSGDRDGRKISVDVASRRVLAHRVTITMEAAFCVEV